ncbi:guanine nucleotide exchange protein for ADP-robosylation factor, partial [Basidiobolus ranarum]
MSETATGPPSPTASTATDISSSTAASKSHLAAGALFIINALEKLQKLKQTKKNKQLDEAVTKALDVIRNYPDASVCTASDSETLFLPLKMACETGAINLIIIAIDCLGSLITYNYIINGETTSVIAPTSPRTSTAEVTSEVIEGQSKVSLEDSAGDLPPVGQIPLTDQLIDLVCDCFAGENTNEKIQLQIIKALLAAITSDTFSIHQRVLLKAVRTTYNIFLLSRDPVNQTIAQGTLTQMVHAIFARIRMKKDAKSNGDLDPAAHTAKLVRSDSGQDVKDIPSTHDSGDLSISTSDTADLENKLSSTTIEDKQESSVEGEKSPNVTASSDIEGKDESSSPVESSLAHTTPEHEQIKSISDEFANIDDDGLVDIPLDSNIEKSADVADVKVEAPTENSALDESTPHTVSETSENQPQPANSDEEQSSHEHKKSDSISSAFKDNEIAKSMATTQDDLPKEHENVENQSAPLNDLEVRDAYLLFRALCRLSMKPITTDGASDVKSLSMRSKLLSLHLILTIITSHLEIFASSNVGFITYTDNNQPVHVTLLTSVKQYLCLSLSRNLTSTVSGVFEVSLEIFLKLLQGLRMLLKKEIEVFFKEIFLPILEMRSASFHQRLALLGVLESICNDPQTLVEIYLNYDCDKEALDNIYERLVNVISKITTIHTAPSPPGSSYPSQHPNSTSPSNGLIQPSLTTTSFNNTLASQLQNQGNENDIRQKALECLVAVLRSLTTWSDKGLMMSEGENGTFDDDKLGRSSPRKSEDVYEINTGSVAELNGYSSPSPVLSTSAPSVRSLALDDPSQFENLKHRKQVLQQGIQMFNWRPKKGLSFLLDTHCIENSEAKTIARFLLRSEGVNKTTLGEFLGEGSEENILIMHAFVDSLNFSKMHFVDALRKFLQPFRLPGEAQKIDRFMLKFAERYVIGNAGVFANADTAYVLAYSVIMLNTDLHNPQVKNRMTKAEFLKNNAGIDDKADLPDKFLEEIYDDISKNEIRIKDEKGIFPNSSSN